MKTSSQLFTELLLMLFISRSGSLECPALTVSQKPSEN